MKKTILNFSICSLLFASSCGIKDELKQASKSTPSNILVFDKPSSKKNSNRKYPRDNKKYIAKSDKKSVVKDNITNAPEQVIAPSVKNPKKQDKGFLSTLFSKDKKENNKAHKDVAQENPGFFAKLFSNKKQEPKKIIPEKLPEKTKASVKTMPEIKHPVAHNSHHLKDQDKLKANITKDLNELHDELNKIKQEIKKVEETIHSNNAPLKKIEDPVIALPAKKPLADKDVPVVVKIDKPQEAPPPPVVVPPLPVKELPPVPVIAPPVPVSLPMPSLNAPTDKLFKTSKDEAILPPLPLNIPKEPALTLPKMPPLSQSSNIEVNILKVNKVTSITVPKRYKKLIKGHVIPRRKLDSDMEGEFTSKGHRSTEELYFDDTEDQLRHNDLR